MGDASKIPRYEDLDDGSFSGSSESEKEVPPREKSLILHGIYPLHFKMRTTYHELNEMHLSVVARRSRSNLVLELFYAYMDCFVDYTSSQRRDRQISLSSHFKVIAV